MITEKIEDMRKRLEQLIQCSQDLSCSEIYKASKELDVLISEYHRQIKEHDHAGGDLSGSRKQF